MIEINCIECGAQFRIKPYRKATAKYCSTSCMHINKEYLLNKSLALKGRSNSPETKFKNGHRQSEESRLKMSEAKLGHIPWNKGIEFEAIKGENNPNWKGGVGTSVHPERICIAYKQWRREVLKRDNHTCQKYGTTGSKLHCHHIVNFSDNTELRFDVSNGITLSKKAHQEFHSRYGNRNNTLEQLTEFLLENHSSQILTMLEGVVGLEA